MRIRLTKLLFLLVLLTSLPSIGQAQSSIKKYVKEFKSQFSHRENKASLFAVENRKEPTPYTQMLSRFENNRDYNPLNASALCEINFNVSRASGLNITDLAPPIGFDQGYAFSGRLFDKRVTNVIAYLFVSTSLNMVVLSFTGTETFAQLLEDLDFIQVKPRIIRPRPEDIRVERGFYLVYRSVADEIRTMLNSLLGVPDRQFVITGHSLGGAVATIAALDLADHLPIVYTSASPRVGNPAFAVYYNQKGTLGYTWRLFNTEDFVPTVPAAEFPVGFKKRIPSIFYEHVGNPVPFTYNTQSLLNNHIKSYQDVIIDRIPPVNPNGICPNPTTCTFQ